MRGVLAALALVTGCDALWGIDTIDPAKAGDAGPPDARRYLDAEPHAGPFLHFPMDEVGATSTSDTVGGAEATCGGGCPTVVAGHVGSALLFSAATGNQRLEIADTPALEIVDHFSVAGWIQLATLAAEACPWSKPYSTGNADTWQLCINVSGSVDFITYSTGGSNNLATEAGWATLDGAFHHIAIVYDGTAKYLYWDGAVAVTQEASVPFVDASDVLIANDLDGVMYVAPLDGAVDDLAFYSYALTPAEVAALAAQ